MQISTALRSGRSAFPAGLVIAIFALLAFSPPAVGGFGSTEIRFEGGRYEVRTSIRFSPDEVSFGTSMGYDTIRLEGCDGLNRAGRPDLPSKSIRMALPEGMKVTAARAHSVRWAELPGTYRVLPARPPRPISPDAREIPLCGPDPRIYESAGAYPATELELVRQSDLAGQSFAMLRIHPIRYLPAEGKLFFAHSIDIILEGLPGHRCGDYLPDRISDRACAAYERALRESVLNPRDVNPTVLPGSTSRGVAPGAYEYVIITQADWVDDFQPLADWRMKTGVPSTIVTTEWIYTTAGYSGSDLEKVRAFVADAHATWGATDFLLGGDSNVIPHHVRTITVPDYSTDDISNDTYYADYDEDWVLEVNVGRATARTTLQIAKIIGKIFTYEKTPPAGYVTTAAFFGMDIGTCGDDYGETSKENYIRPYLPPAWTLTTEYDSEPGTHKADILGILNTGHHLVNHHDHCNVDCMGTGWICHAELMYNADVDALTNADRLSIIFAVGCHPCDFPAAPACIAEKFQRANPTGGAVAFMGNTFTGWGGSIEDQDHYNLRQDRLFYRNLFELGIHHLGENFTRLKNDAFAPGDPYNLCEYTFTEMHLIGDPGLTIWTEDPGVLVVSHDGTVPVGQPATFPVQVSDGRAPVDGATVCLWKDGDVYEIEETSGGTATFNFTPASEGTLFVTARKHNYLPNEGSALVTDLSSVARSDERAPARLELTSISPNPFNPVTEITYAVPSAPAPGTVHLTIYDCRGRRVCTLVLAVKPAGLHAVAWDGRDDRGIEAASGVYFCELRWNGEKRTKRLVLLK